MVFETPYPGDSTPRCLLVSPAVGQTVMTFVPLERKKSGTGDWSLPPDGGAPLWDKEESHLVRQSLTKEPGPVKNRSDLHWLVKKAKDV